MRRRVKQDSNTKYVAFRLPRLIREFSTGMALEPGDVMEAEVEKIGVLPNPVVAYPSNASRAPASPRAHVESAV